MAKIKQWIRYVLRVIFGCLLLIAILLFAAGLVFMIPSVQTRCAQKVATYLSEELQTNIRIQKLRLYWNLDLKVDGFCIEDQHQQPMLAAQSLSCHFPSINRYRRIINFPEIWGDSVWVYMAKYKGEENGNMDFLFDYFSSDSEQEPMKLYFNGIHLKRSNYIYYDDRDCETDVPGYWNYNHIRIFGIEADIRRLEIIDGACHMNIARLDAKEQSGFSIHDFQSKATFSKQQLYFENTRFHAGRGSQIDMDFRFDFNSWADFSNFNDSVFFRCKLRPSHLHLADLYYFSKNLHGWNNPTAVQLQGNVNNSLSHMEITQCQIKLNDSCCINGDLITQNIQSRSDAYWDIKIDEAKGKIWDVNGFVLPNGNAIKIPKILKNCILQNTMLDFHGYFDQFTAEGKVQTNLGEIELKGNYSASSAYHAQLQTQHLDLKKLLGLPLLGKLSARGEINGKGQEIEEYRVNIEHLNVNGQNISHTQLSGDLEDGRLGVQLLSADPELKAHIKGFIDFQNQKTYYAVGEVERFNLNAFHLIKDSSETALTFHTKIDFVQEKDSPALIGQLQTSQAALIKNGRSVRIPFTRVFVDYFPNGKQSLKLQSQPIEAQVESNLPLKGIPNCLMHFMQDYLPYSTYIHNCPIPDSASLKIDVVINQKTEIIEELLPQIRIAPESKIHLNFQHATNDFSIKASTPHLKFKQVIFNKCELQSQHNKQNFNLVAQCERIAWNPKDSLSDLQKIQFQSDCFHDTIAFNLEAKQCAYTQSAPIDIQGILHFEHFYRAVLQLQKGIICLKDKPFQIDTQNHIVFEKNSIHYQHLKFTSEQQSFAIDGNTYNHHSQLGIHIHELNLSEFEHLLQAQGLSVGGIATGNFYLNRQLKVPQFASKIAIDSLIFNNVELGNLNGKAQWIEPQQQVSLQLMLYPLEGQLPSIQLNGFYQPKENFIDLDGNIQTIDLHILKEYLTSFSHHVEGDASAKLKVFGPMNKPKIKGILNFKDAYLGIDYTKTIYHLQNQIVEIKDSSFLLEEVKFTDEQGNPGIINGSILQQQFTQWWGNLNIDFQNAMVLNTEYKDNELFYGKAYGTGNLRVRMRPEGGVYIGGNVRTEEATDISILLNKATSVQQQQSYIQFEKPYSLKNSETAEEETTATTSQTRLQLNINITPEATVKVLLNPSIGGSILGHGNGSLRLDMQADKPFEMYGNYTLSEGSVDLALGNIFTRTLKIEKGSSLNWNGNPEKGQLDVHALYTTKTSITNLLGESAVTSSYRSVPVTTALNLKGELLNPDFGFDIRLNDVDESIRSLAYNAIDTTDKEEMFRQAFSLLLFGRFDLQSTNNDNTNTYNIGYSLSELLSHYIQKMMSTLTDNVNFGFLYRQGDGITAGNEYNVQLSTNLMEDRLSIQSSLDIYGENSELREKQAVAGNVVGDIIAEYKITKDGSLRVKAFNMANYYDVLSAVYSDVPYYQGIGISVTKDFNTIKDLLRRKKKGVRTSVPLQ